MPDVKAEPTTGPGNSLRDRGLLVETVLLGGAFLILYGLTLFPSPPPVGDAADYTALIRDGVFPPRMAAHIGYYVLMRPVMIVAGALGLSAAFVANFAAAIAMAGAMAMAYILFLHLDLERPVAVTATLILGFSGLFWYNALFGEVNALSMFLSFASAVLFLIRRPLFAGGLLGLALLVSQLAATWAPVFLILALWKRDWKGFALATLAGSLVLGLGVLPVFNDYLYGPRGVFSVAEYTTAASLAKWLLFFPYRLLESFTVLLPAIVLGIAVAARRYRWTLALTAALYAATAVVSIRSPHVEYGVAWLPAMLGISGLGAVGVHALADRTSNASYRFAARFGPVALAAILSWFLFVGPKRTEAMRFADEAVAVAKLVGTNSVVAPVYEGMAYVFLTQPTVGDVWESNWVKAPTDSEGWNELLATPPVFAFTTEPKAYVFRRWIFNNPLAARFLNENQRANYTSEQEGFLEESYAAAEGGIRLEPVLETGYMRVWRLYPIPIPPDGGP
jgi:hypothetical protein